MDYCCKNIPFYHDRLEKAGVTAEKIKTLDDIQYIPYTTKDDIRDNYPFGLFGQPIKNIVRIHASSGTTGKPTVVGYTKNDLDNWSDCMARLCMAAGATDEDIVQIAFDTDFLRVLWVFITDLKKSEPQLSPHQAAILKNKLC